MAKFLPHTVFANTPRQAEELLVSRPFRPVARSMARWLPSMLVAVLTLCLSWAAPASADVLNDVRSHSSREGKHEVAFVLTGWVNAADAAKLAKCLPKKERRLPKTGDAAKAFAGLRWTNKALNALDRCGRKDCRFNFEMPARLKVAQAQGRDAKKRAYYEAVRQAAWTVNKKKKSKRIEQHAVKSETCSNHNLFHWLINGTPKKWDKVFWRKHFGKSSRMRPTLEVLQSSVWQKGTSQCVGTTILFADHYYDDSIELLQLTPLGNGRVAFRQYTRIRFDFFGSWWARRFRGTIRKQARQKKLKILRNRMRRCGVK
jgi:hypothetical protein